MRTASESPNSPPPRRNSVAGSGITSLTMICPRIWLGGLPNPVLGLTGGLIGVELSMVNVISPKEGELKVNVVGLVHCTKRPDSVCTSVPTITAVKLFGLTSPGTVKVTVSVTFAPLKLGPPGRGAVEVEVATKVPSVTLEKTPGVTATSICGETEVPVMVDEPVALVTVMELPVGETVPPEVPAWKVIEVLAFKVMGSAKARPVPETSRVKNAGTQSRVSPLNLFMFMVPPSMNPDCCRLGEAVTHPIEDSPASWQITDQDQVFQSPLNRSAQ